MDDGSIDPYQPNAAWIAVRGNRIEFPSTERGKRQECGGLDGGRGESNVLYVCALRSGSITLILTMSSGNEKTNSTYISRSSSGASSNTISNNAADN